MTEIGGPKGWFGSLSWTFSEEIVPLYADCGSRSLTFLRPRSRTLVIKFTNFGGPMTGYVRNLIMSNWCDERLLARENCTFDLLDGELIRLDGSIELCYPSSMHQYMVDTMDTLQQHLELLLQTKAEE